MTQTRTKAPSKPKKKKVPTFSRCNGGAPSCFRSCKIEDRRELAAVLAGLRLLLRGLILKTLPDGIHDVYTDGEELAPLSLEEIEHLCERLNCGP